MVTTASGRQRKHPVPQQESQRLQELHSINILDTPPDEEFDRLTEIAKRELGVDVAAVTFIDSDRQFLKSSSGLPREDMDRDESYCTYTILTDEATIVEDSRDDERFGEEYLVLEGREVRTYAGVPLTTKNGHRLGSFCVFGFEPRSYDSSELQLLKLLRDQTMSLIESHHHENQLRELALYDTVTGLPKRHRFRTEFETMLENHARDDKKLSVAHLDLTRFRRVNETLGHSAAEEVLATVANRIVDVLPEEALITRVLGDEFLLVLPELVSEDQVKDQAREVLAAIRESISIEDESFLFSGRMGLTFFPRMGTTAEDLLRQADAALKQASAETGSALMVYLEGMGRNSLEEVQLEKDFQRALDRDGLSLNYQPKVDLETGRINGVEALIRWNHPEVGFVPPPTIVSLAETLGEMSNLGQWVMERACRQVKQWMGEVGRPLRLGVNVSALEFQQGENFLTAVRKILDSTNFPAEHLMVEITETEAMDDIQFTIDLLEDLRKLGVSVAIDDYGTGESSLKYLSRFPEPVLKIDRAFVDGSTEDPTSRSIVKNTVNLARDLGLETIAEGVEREEEETFLKSLGCDSYQGYYFSKPVDAATFSENFL